MIASAPATSPEAPVRPARVFTARALTKVYQLKQGTTADAR